MHSANRSCSLDRMGKEFSYFFASTASSFNISIIRNANTSPESPTAAYSVGLGSIAGGFQ